MSNFNKPHFDEHCHNHIMHQHPCVHEHNLYSFTHQFNKVCFKNYNEAVTMLKHKELLPGEFAFAYYYDKAADFGVNAIAAVGSIKVGAPNIIFDNASLIQNTFNDINYTVASNNEKVEDCKNITERLINIVETIIPRIESLEAAITKLQGTSNQSNISTTSLEDRLDKIEQAIETDDTLNEDTH